MRKILFSAALLFSSSAAIVGAQPSSQSVNGDNGTQVICSNGSTCFVSPRNQKTSTPQLDTHSKPPWCSRQPSFNRSEMLVCADKELSQLDLQLITVYGAAVPGMSVAKRKIFDTENDKWSKMRDTCDGHRDCVLGSYRKRIERLKQLQ
jgi:uncharacterized protein YecT (DUF1311 family)